MTRSLLHIGCWLYCAVAALSAGGANCAAADNVSFRTDVMAVLSKAGCNQGVCHGNQNGKGGFRLSLRGQDADWDLAQIVRDQAGRRIDGLSPAESLLLKKPSMQVAHEGGQRFTTDSAEYKLLQAWIAGGARDDIATAPRLKSLTVAPAGPTYPVSQQPSALFAVVADPQETLQLQVTATFEDGSQRDVTRHAVYDPAERLVTVNHDGLVRRQAFGETAVLVRYLEKQVAFRVAFVPARADFALADPPPGNYIDDLVWAKLRQLRITPADVCTDSVFVRRVYFDLLNIPPTADEAREFVNNSAANKREELVDRLLARPEFAAAWALRWSDLLHNEEKTLDRKGVQAFHHWIERSIAADKPLNEFARELISARGSTYQSPPANFYRALRDPVSRSEAVAQVFLGVRLQCAKCHNHPFESWTQDDYYRWAGFFARVEYKVLENNRRDDNDKHEFDGEQIVWMKHEGEVKDPRTNKSAKPKFLGEPKSRLDEDQDRLEALADWVADPKNRFFAAAQANRIWYHMLGRGVVDPIDDLRETNPATNPSLLEALAKDFAAQKFSLRGLVRRIALSRTYQLASEPNATNADDDRNFSHALVRRLSAEQLLEASHRVAGVEPKFNGYPQGIGPTQLPGVAAMPARRAKPSMDDQFLTLFGKPQRLLSCECERSTGTTLSQAFAMISGPMINDLLSSDEGRIARLSGESRPTSERIAELYWTALARAPTAEELQATCKHVDQSPDYRKGLEDVVWSLLNAKEFLLRR
jgi:hypothetical protein